jgi:hypothetical protein
MTDNIPEAKEPLNLAVLRLVGLKAEGGWVSPSAEHSTASGSGVAAGSGELDTAADVVAVGSV